LAETGAETGTAIGVGCWVGFETVELAEVAKFGIIEDGTLMATLIVGAGLGVALGAGAGVGFGAALGAGAGAGFGAALGAGAGAGFGAALGAGAGAGFGGGGGGGGDFLKTALTTFLILLSNLRE